MAMDLNVYNYLMTGYNTKPAASKYGAHKTSELRSIVRDIAKRTKSSPNVPIPVIIRTRSMMRVCTLSW